MPNVHTAGVAGSHLPERAGITGLALAALGVVYGDIGTSPLYTIHEVFAGTHPVTLTETHALGVLSLIFWALMIVVSLKYVVFVMRANNRGEGGIMALMALALRAERAHPRQMVVLMALGIFGAALFYGDGMVTPAISVLSAVEGLEVATPLFKPYIIPLTIAVLVGLFIFQRKGTGSVGALFGPIMCIWFVTLAVLGILNIAQQPDVLVALNPFYAVRFLVEYSWHAFLALGAVVLALTGAEALYADMGHFGRKPIHAAWFWFVLPSLAINYFGQGALLIARPDAVQNPFYLLAPDWLLYPMVALATVATVIASQAVISGAFSMTRQAMQLGYSPRLAVRHTSEREIGQIYVPAINWMLLAAVIALVLGFKSSSNLAAAYGIAVTGTMVITTVLAYIVARHLWGWGRLPSALFLGFFLVIDVSFFAANLVKIADGGWFPLVMGLSIFTLLSTWKRGRVLLHERIHTDAIPLDSFIKSLFHEPPQRVAGTGVFMTTAPQGVPHALLHNLLHNKVLHERVVLLTVVTEDVPYVPDAERVRVQPLDFGFYRVLVRYGFKDEPDIPRALRLCETLGVTFEMMETSFFLGRETIVPRLKPAMALWREKLFIFMFRNGSSAAAFFKIPPNRVVELGTQVEM